MDSVAPYYIYFKLCKILSLFFFLSLGLLMDPLLMINYSTNINKVDKLPVNDYKETQYSISCFN